MIKPLWNAFLYSLAGLKIAFEEERAFRQEVILSLVLLPVGAWMAPSRFAFAVMVLSWSVVLVAELLNTGIEAAINRIGLERHPLSKKAKDTASAAVLVALVQVVIVWGAILIP